MRLLLALGLIVAPIALSTPAFAANPRCRAKGPNYVCYLGAPGASVYGLYRHGAKGRYVVSLDGRPDYKVKIQRRKLGPKAVKLPFDSSNLMNFQLVAIEGVRQPASGDRPGLTIDKSPSHNGFGQVMQSPVVDKKGKVVKPGDIGQVFLLYKPEYPHKGLTFTLEQNLAAATAGRKDVMVIEGQPRAD